MKDYEEAEHEVEQALQMAVSEVSSEDPRFLERAPPPLSEEFPQGSKVFFLSAAVIAAACVVFSITRMFASPQRPRTMTKEWQEATEEYLKVSVLWN